MRISQPLLLAVVVGCAGGGTVPGSSTPGTPKEPVSIATSKTDHTIGALAPAPLESGAGALDTAITSYYERAQTKRTYLQTDKPLYQPGETIWFRADLRATGTLLGGQPVGMTIQLMSPRGAIVATRRVLVQNGIARNDLKLADELEGGEYSLVLTADDGTTETRKLVVNTYEAPRLQKTLELLRKAYGEGDSVTAAIEIKRATGEPFADHALTGVVTIDDVETQRIPLKTDKEGKTIAKFALPAKMARGDGLLTILAEEGGVTESIQKRIPIVMKSLQLAVFPEGGDLVDGVPGRVYFMAKTLIGKPADIEGKVIDEKGQTVSELTSVHDGMGRFELTPQTDRKYQIVITKPAGITAKFAVPAAKSGGCVIRSVDQKGRDMLRIAAICNTGRRLQVEAVMREKRLGSGGFEVVANQPTVVEIPVDPKTQGQGVVRVTLFSAGNEPLAERLVYHNIGADLKIELTADKKTYSPRDPVKLRVKTTDASGKPVKANIGLAVVDETVLSFADDKSARILARMYLEPELGTTVADPIEEPNFYFGDKPEAAAAMDALLATRGYRRFEWRPITGSLGGAQ
ncbi:MAG: MG2 domain-containing protein [Kofleriaceae bacterium]